MSASQPANFNLQEFSDAGLLLFGGRLYTYAYGTTAQKTAYTDPAGAVPHTYTADGAGGQYIALNARGELPAPLYLATGSYDLVLKRGDGSTIWTRKADGVDNTPNSLAAALAASTGASLVGVGGGRTVADAIVGETSDVGYATLQAAVTAAVGKKLRITRQWTLTAAVSVDSNTHIYFVPGALVTTTTPDISLFNATGKTNIHFSGFGKLSQTVAGAGAYIGAIVFDTCTDCTVIGKLEFVGFQWCGVWIVNSSRCRVSGGYFHDWLGSVNDSGGVIIQQNSNDNIVENIQCKATGWIGAYIQDPGGAGVYNPLRNKIRNCRIQDTTAYGAMLYLGHAGNSYNEITGCTISGVLGTAGLGQYGMGIYTVGAGLGGCKVLDNSVTDCCKNQTVTTNGYAGIVVTGNAVGYVKPIISGNSVDGMTQGGGIQVISCLGGAVVGPNSTHIPASNNGTGPGGAGLLGQGLLIWNSDDVSVSPGDYVNLGTGPAILINATDASHSGITLNIGNARAASGNGLLVQRQGGAWITSGSINGGTVKSTADAATAMQLVGFSGPVSDVTVINGTTAAAVPALSTSNCVNVRFSNMNISSTGTYSVSIGSSSGYWDKNSSYTGRFENSSATFKTEFYNAGIPTVGIFQIGDRAINSSVVVGVSKAWSRATAGAAHVPAVDWISEGNL